MRCTPLSRLLVLSAAAFVGLAGFSIPAFSANLPNRITATVSNSNPVGILNSVHPRARRGTDLGPTAADTLLVGMSLRFNMTDAQQAALDQLLVDLQDPSSSRYHQWLTPTQYAAQFGVSSTDIAKVTAWLTSQGFTVTGVANGGTFVTFNGTVALAQAAFSTSIHNLSLNGETHFANMTNVSVPRALGGIVADVTGLHNFRLKPHVHTDVVKPQFTSSVSGNHYMAPGDLYTIYNIPSSLTGAGEAIAVTGQVDINLADVTAFRSAAGLSTTNLPTTVHAGTDPGQALSCTNCTPSQEDLAESSIDVEWSGAMAPAATILFVNATHILPGGIGIDAMTYAIDNNVAPIVTTSYGSCEQAWGVNDLNSTNALFKQAVAQGQTVLAASADEGATDCDQGPTALEGLNVDFPASSPFVTGMGGTQPNEGSGNYWNTTNSATGGSAISYIPEAVWNDQSFGSYGGSGGGPSAFFTKPTWQVGTGVPADASRDVPDLALNATDNGSHGSFLFCINVSSGVSCGSGFRVSASNTGLNVAGGTSFDSQIFGGMLALIEQQIGARVGNANRVIYALANNAAYYTPGQNILNNPNVVFNDVTTGSNAMACTTGTPNCPNGGSTGFSAGVGYDLATGWGSVNVAKLANAWNAVTPLGLGSLGTNITATTVSASPTSAAIGATVTLTATVTGLAGTPTGTVQFLANDVPQGSPVPVTTVNGTSATATYAWVASCAAFGQQVISASYSGDANYQGSKGPALTPGGTAFITPVIVQVTSTSCPDFSLPSSVPVTTVAAGGSVPSTTITVTPANGFIGTVAFTASVASTSGFAPTLTFTPATLTFTAGNNTVAQTTTLTESGIVASLHIPNAPGNIEPGHRMPWYATDSGVTIASLLLLLLPRKRRLGGLLLVALSVALIGGATGCSSGGSGSTTTTINANPYAGTYVVTVIGTFTSSTRQTSVHTSTVTYVIN